MDDSANSAFDNPGPEIKALRAEQQKHFELKFKALVKLCRSVGYHGTCRAMTYAQQMHPGYRKNGYTPNFFHQIEVAFLVYDRRFELIRIGLNPDVVIGIALLHDTPEENEHLTKEAMLARGTDIETWPEIIDGALEMDKVRKKKIALAEGRNFEAREYYLSLSLPAMICKLCDRLHNLRTIDALSPGKKTEQLIESMVLLDVSKLFAEHHSRAAEIILGLRRDMKALMDLCTGMVRSMRLDPDGTIQAFRDAGLLHPHAIARGLPDRRCG